MLTNELPNCPICSNHQYSSNGSSIGGGLVQQDFRCQSCGSSAQFTGSPEGSLLAFFSEGTVHFPKAYLDWMNQKLLVAWRVRAEEVKEFRKMEWNRWLGEVLLPRFPECRDYAEGDRSLAFRDLPQSAKDMIVQVQGRRHGYHLPVPAQLKEPVYPPAIPRLPGVVFLAPTSFSIDCEWVAVDYDRSASQPIVEDPILRCNREFFSGVWAGLQANNHYPQNLTETKNEYGGSEPWFTFYYSGAKITAGWRKRVISIQVDCANTFTGKMPTAKLREVAVADGVTFIPEGPLRNVTHEEYEGHLLSSSNPEDQGLINTLVASFREEFPNGTELRLEGGWGSTLEFASLVTIHAWGAQKTIEYLTLICQTLKEEGDKTIPLEIRVGSGPTRVESLP